MRDVVALLITVVAFLWADRGHERTDFRSIKKLSSSRIKQEWLLQSHCCDDATCPVCGDLGHIHITSQTMMTYWHCDECNHSWGDKHVVEK